MPSNVREFSLDGPMMTASVRSHPRRVVEARSEGTLPVSPDIISMPKRTWRIIVLGSPRVGKTCVLSRFLYKKFPEKPTRHVDEMHRVDYSVNGIIVTAEILDTTGYANFPTMQELAIQQADAFFLVFSPDSEESLEFIKSIKQEIIRIKQIEQRCLPVIPIVVVCNKMDLPLSRRTVDLNYVEFLVKCDWEKCGLVKTSAKDDYGIHECFKEMLIGMKLRLPRNTVIRRVKGGLSRINSAPAGLRPSPLKFGSPKLLQKFRDRTPPFAANEECIIN